MRFLKLDNSMSLSLTDDLPDQDIPEYVILSHTWGIPAQEVSFQDFQGRPPRSRKRKIGYKKIQFCADQAARDEYQYFWIDTCCIDKTNHAELSEAINSMFRWYRQAARCYVYLDDVNVINTQSDTCLVDFRKSKWFTRGWTLQELLAPRSVEFFSSNGTRIGDRGSLESEIHEATGIHVAALRGRSLADFSVSERIGWASKRQTTRKEDEAYSLLGLFNIHMPLIYGEREKAFERLTDEIQKSLRDSDISSTNTRGTSTRMPHPVQNNYRRVHVTLLYWEIDDQRDLIQRITDVFRSLYHYDVRHLPLPHRQHEKLGWPWTDRALVDERDLQIIFYLGNTLGSVAYPAKAMTADEAYPNRLEYSQGDTAISRRPPTESWMSTMLHFPNLLSDAFVVLDCFSEGLLHANPSEGIRFLQDPDYAWARYHVVLAGYDKPPLQAGKLAVKLMSILEELARSKRFYARAGLITTRTVQERLERAFRFDEGLEPQWYGGEEGGSIRISPLSVLST